MKKKTDIDVLKDMLARAEVEFKQEKSDGYTSDPSIEVGDKLVIGNTIGHYIEAHFGKNGELKYIGAYY